MKYYRAKDFTPFIAGMKQIELLQGALLTEGEAYRYGLSDQFLKDNFETIHISQRKTIRAWGLRFATNETVHTHPSASGN